MSEYSIYTQYVYIKNLMKTTDYRDILAPRGFRNFPKVCIYYDTRGNLLPSRLLLEEKFKESLINPYIKNKFAYI